MTTTPDEPDPPDELIITSTSTEEMNARIDRMNEAMRRFSEAMVTYYERYYDLPVLLVQRGGITYPKPDPRIGRNVEVRDLVPGDRVFILEGVFTVLRLDMKAPIPTLWLEELPTSPLYFEYNEYIPLANETED